MLQEEKEKKLDAKENPAWKDHLNRICLIYQWIRIFIPINNERRIFDIAFN